MTKPSKSVTKGDTPPYSMTCPRPGRRGLWVVAVTMFVVWTALPRIAAYRTAAQFERDDRTHPEHSEDYWLAARHASHAFANEQAIVVGDSVVWGEYVEAKDALSAQLNRIQPYRKFANRGTNGLHPLAIEGLLRSYLRPRGERVVLHINPLWYTSKSRDLSDPDGLSFNHPRLIPQFTIKVPAYEASIEDRLAVTVERTFQLRQWARHLWIQHLQGQDLPRWTLDHPTKFFPLQESTIAARKVAARPWTEKGIQPQDFDWVSHEDSLQWAAMQRSIIWLRERRNQVFVVVGPFNVHLLTDSGRSSLDGLRKQFAAWLEREAVPFYLAEPLPSPQYADASHPLAVGYETMARRLWKHRPFRKWCE